jgi:hypothetical protein
LASAERLESAVEMTSSGKKANQLPNKKMRSAKLTSVMLDDHSLIAFAKLGGLPYLSAFPHLPISVSQDQ